MATISEEISKIVGRLSPNHQQKVLEFVQKLTQTDHTSTPLSLPTTPLPPGTPGSTLLQLRFLSSREDVEAMERALEDVAERSLLLGSTDPRPAHSPDVVAGATSGLLSPFFVAPVISRPSTPVRSFICFQP